MYVVQSRSLYRLCICIAVFAIAWFSLGNTLNTIVAMANGKTIDFIICTGAGVKKLSASKHEGNENSNTIKHCGNAPIYKLIAIPGIPVHLNFEAPHTVAVWQWIPRVKISSNLIQVNKPPPGRAPPGLVAHFVA
jgi:hypothetical protein